MSTGDVPTPERPTPEQHRAIEARDRDVLLAAGAGTGKTRVLAERYCAAIDDLLAEGEADPARQILAFTFTERAAAELRERIRGMLGRRSGSLAVLRSLDGAPISTIHGFCRRLVSAYPTRLGLDPRFGVADEAAAERLAGRAFDAALEEFLAGGSRERARLVASFQIRSLREAVPAIHAELRSQGREPELPVAPEPDPAGALAALRTAALAAAEECAEAGGVNADDFRERIDTAATLPEEPLPASADVAALWFKSKAGPWCGQAAEAYKEAVNRAAKALAEHESRDDYESLRNLLRAFARHYAALKRERSCLDFEDLQLEAVRLLSSDAEVRDRERSRFRHLMVDEFQDTNQVQLELIGLLRGPDAQVFTVGDELQSIYSFRHADVEVFNSTRDEFDQAPDERAAAMRLSGSFRSSPGVVAAINELGTRLIRSAYEPLSVGVEPGEPEDMTELERALEGEPPAELLVVAASQNDDWAVRAEELGLRYEGDNAPAPSRVAEARMLATRLRELHDKGVKQREMVVLLRALTPVAAIEGELRRAGLDPYVVGGRGYWQQQQVEDLRRILAAIANPLDDLGLLGALASPACACSPDALWLLRQAAGEGRLWPALVRGVEGEEPIEGIGEEDFAKLRDFCDRLLELRERLPLIGLERLAEEAVSVLGYDLAVLARDDGRRRMANVRKLLAMARDYEGAEGRDVRGFLEHLDDRAAAAEGEAAVAAEGRDVVRIMTVHAAKGLEFPVVAFADLGRRLLDGAFPPVLRVGRTKPGGLSFDEIEAEEEAEAAAAQRVGVRMARLGYKRRPIYDYEALQEEADAEGEREALRLAHVAVTRAERHLILSGRVSPAALKKDEESHGTPVAERLLRAWGVRLAPDEDADEKEAARMPELDRRDIELPAAEPRPGLDAGPFEPASLAVTIARPGPEWAAAMAPEDRRRSSPSSGDLETPLLAELDTGRPVAATHLSYTAISEFEHCGLRFYFERVLGLPPDDLFPGSGVFEGSTQLGSAVHELLEASARAGWAEPGDEQIAEALVRNSCEAAQADEVWALIDAWLQSPALEELSSRGAAVHAELPFALGIGGAVVRGSIDLLAEVPGEPPLVVDYKTNRLESRSPATLVAEDYAGQRDIYALAAASGGAETVMTAYAFLRSDAPPERKLYDAAELEAARSRVEALVAKIRSGEFTAVAPDERTCARCPARLRLCPSWTRNDGGEIVPASEPGAAAA